MDSWWFKWFLLKKRILMIVEFIFNRSLSWYPYRVLCCPNQCQEIPGILEKSLKHPWSILEASLKHPPWLDEFQLINKSPEESPEEFWFGTLFRILYANWSRQKKRKWLLAVLVFLLLLFATNWLLFHIWNHFGYPVITAGLFRQSSWQWIDPSHSI